LDNEANEYDMMIFEYSDVGYVCQHLFYLLLFF